MKRLFSSLLFAGLLLVLGAAAFLAFPGGGLEVAQPDPVLDAGAAPAAQNEAPTVTQNWNAIAIPLDASSTITNAQGIADQITGTQRVMYWNPASQAFSFYIPNTVVPGGFPPSPVGGFSTHTGGAYFVLVDGTAPTAFTVVGDVPPQTGDTGAVQFSIAGGSPCEWNFLSIPLDQSSLVNAQALADSIGAGTVERIMTWNSSSQAFSFYIPNPIVPGGFPPSPVGGFSISIGNPYFLCVSSATTWPTP